MTENGNAKRRLSYFLRTTRKGRHQMIRYHAWGHRNHWQPKKDLQVRVEVAVKTDNQIVPRIHV